MRTSCEVSIIVPCYKRQEKLARALASIKSACCLPHEIILVDDCAEGSGFEVGRPYGVRYFLKAGIDQGLSTSRNIGLKLARGRYVLFLDDDDFLLPQAIDLLHNAITKGHSFAFGNHVLLFSERRVATNLKALTHEDLLVSNQIPVGSYLIEKSIIKSPFDHRLKSHEDWDFILGNIDWNRTVHVDQAVVVIDKTENKTTSHQAIRRKHFWMDFLYMYTRYPAEHLAQRRKQQLRQLGVNLGDLDINN